MEYIKSIWNEMDVKGNFLGEYIYFSEVNMITKSENRKVVYYPDGIIKAADTKGGYLGEEIAHGTMFEESLIIELNNPPETTTEKISKEQFETEWQKATSQPGFEMKPYNC